MTVPGVDADDPSTDPGLRPPARRPPGPHQPPHRRPRPGLSPEQVAGYLAKYATKSASDTGAADNAAPPQIRATARDLALRAEAHAIEDSYELLGKWAHMLGFRGHFASKSRRYSVTLGALRRARRRAQALIAASHAEGRPLDLAALEADLLAEDDTETTLVIGHWQYVGIRLGHRRRTGPCRRSGRPSPRVRPMASGAAKATA